MKFHRTLLTITIVNAIACYVVFYILNEMQRKDANATGINTALGWIFWLGMFAIVAPAFLSDEVKASLFKRPFFGGTLILAIINIGVPIVCALLTR
jgi:hypothetical protein